MWAVGLVRRMAAAVASVHQREVEDPVHDELDAGPADVAIVDRAAGLEAGIDAPGPELAGALMQDGLER